MAVRYLAGAVSIQLGSGGAYAIGDDASSTSSNPNLLAADIAEQIIFAAWTLSDLTLMMNNMRAFWGTP